MTSDSPGIVLFMDDTLTSHLGLFLWLALSSRYGKMVSTLRIWEILGIKTELNKIYDRHQGVLNLSLLEWLFHRHRHWNNYQTAMHVGFPALNTVLLCQQKADDISYNCFMTLL